MLAWLSCAVMMTSASEATSEPETVEAPRIERLFGLNVSLNGTVSADFHASHFYGFASFNFGVPLVQWVVLGRGFDVYYILDFGLGAEATASFARTTSSQWNVDLFVMSVAETDTAFQRATNNGANFALYGAGLGAGLRYLNANGFVFAIKIPLVGATFPRASAGESLAFFYLENVAALPLLSVGYRW